MSRLTHSESRLFALMALIPLMLITPVYCYEHHMALLLVPVIFVLKHSKQNLFRDDFFGVVPTTIWGTAIVFSKMDATKIVLGEWWFQESKFIFIVLIGCYCVWYAQ